MHEWRLMRAIVNTVIDTANARGAARVREVTLVLGPATAIAPELLRAQFAVAAAGSIAQDAFVRLLPAPAEYHVPGDGIVVDSIEVGA